MKRGKQPLAQSTTYRTTIKEWPKGERPREKLIRHGCSSLSEAELIAILLRSGRKGVTAVDLGKRILTKSRTLRNVSRMGVSDFRELEVGSVASVTLVAAFELARRLSIPVDEDSTYFRSPEDVVHRYAPKLKDLKHEEFWVLLLTSANQLMQDIRVTSGTLNSSLVHPRECYSEAIKQRAASVIFIHNHPSGNPEPSNEDIAITRQLVEAGKILGIPLHDHVIIADGAWRSFAQLGLL